MHGGLWLNLKTTGAVQQRARSAALRSWYAVAVLTAAATVASFQVQPHLGDSLRAQPWLYVFPALALASLAAVNIFLRNGGELQAFLASALYIVGMLTSVVFTVFPYVLPATDPRFALTVANASAPAYGLEIGIGWFIPGALLAAFYFVYLYRKFAGKVTLQGAGH
jgi:cytochrome d ubiquinol oxidase subunit II